MAKKYGPKNYVGKVKKAKDSERRYIQLDTDITIHGKNGNVKVAKGSFINLVTPDDLIADYKDAVDNGRMTEEQAEEKIQKALTDKKFNVRFTMIHQEVTES
jgi:hypothetical protein